MANRFRKRYVEGPDGIRWVVARHWLARRPGYLGYRFRRPKPIQEFEPPLKPEIHRLRANPIQPPLPNPYRDNRELARRDRGSGWIFWGGRWGGGGWRGSSGGGRSGGGFGGGGGSRSSSGGGGRRSSSGGGGSRKGGGGGGGAGAASGAAGLLAVLAKALLYILIAVAIAAVAALTVFVLVPGLIFLAEYAMFWLLVGGWILYNTLTGRPWVIGVTRYEYEEPEWAFRVKGWKNSQLVIDDLADDLRRGEAPVPNEVAVEVELIED